GMRKLLMETTVAVPGRGIEAVSDEVPALGTTEVLITPRHSYISAGTELKSLQRTATADGGSESHQLGYSQAGVVVGVGADVRRIRVGDRVAAVGRGAFHATHAVVNQNLAPVPDQVDLADIAVAAMF